MEIEEGCEREGILWVDPSADAASGHLKGRRDANAHLLHDNLEREVNANLTDKAPRDGQDPSPEFLNQWTMILRPHAGMLAGSGPAVRPPPVALPDSSLQSARR